MDFLVLFGRLIGKFVHWIRSFRKPVSIDFIDIKEIEDHYPKK